MAEPPFLSAAGVRGAENTGLPGHSRSPHTTAGRPKDHPGSAPCSPFHQELVGRTMVWAAFRTWERLVVLTSVGPDLTPWPVKWARGCLPAHFTGHSPHRTAQHS